MTEAAELAEGFRETEIGLLPSDWKIAKLGELCNKPEYGITASATENPTDVKFLRITDIQEGRVIWASIPYCQCSKEEFEKYKLHTGDIVIARIGATTGKTYLIVTCPKSVFASYLIRMRTNDMLLPEYLDHFTNTGIYWKQINSSKGGRLKQGINIPILKNLSIPLPPLAEQQKIASVLSTIQEAKEKTENVIKANRELKKSMMKHLFTYGPVPFEEAEKVPLKETEIGMIPEHWEVIKLGDYCMKPEYGLTASAIDKAWSEPHRLDTKDL
jgi:type I restriction enzyme S subunit